MFDFFLKLFDTSGFPPRWTCGNWTESHGWLHIISDVAVFGAYAAIPISIASYIITKKQEVAFQKLYWLFAAFILSCGFTHLVDATLFWQPWYRFSGVMKATTAVVSWATVIVLIRTLPVAMKLPGTARLADRLTEEVEERKRSEAALRETTERLTLAMEHSDLGDWSWHADSGKCNFSRRAAAMLGLLPSTETTWEEIMALVHPADSDGARSAFQKTISEKTDYDDEYRVLQPGNKEVWISAKGRAQYDSTGKVTTVIGTLADITERKDVEAVREKLLADESLARTAAERANLMKDEFLATLSHELRTPLNAIAGWSSLLRDNHSDEEELKTGLEVIERNTHVQARLIEDLLDMSRIITGKIRLDVQPVDLTRVIESALDAVRPSAESKKVRLISVLDPLAGPVRGDPARLQQVVWNLLTNAIKFTSAGGKVEVALERVNSHVEMTVSDNGSGIEPEFLPFVFDRFRQADSSTSRVHGGLGLGLAIVKNLAEMHGGSVHAKSAGPGQGATFRVALPLPSAHGSSQPSADRAHPASRSHIDIPDAAPPDLTGSRILILDDEQDSLDLVKRILEKSGATVHATSSGEDAIATLSAGSFHTLISDIGMPIIDGFEVIQRVRALPPEQGGRVPAIVLTAFARSEDRRRAMIAGFDTFVSKPVDPAELLAAVFRSVTRGQQSDGS